MEHLHFSVMDGFVIWSILCLECNYFTLLEVVCQVAKFRIDGILAACRAGMAFSNWVLSKCMKGYKKNMKKKNILEKKATKNQIIWSIIYYTFQTLIPTSLSFINFSNEITSVLQSSSLTFALAQSGLWLAQLCKRDESVTDNHLWGGGLRFQVSLTMVSVCDSAVAECTRSAIMAYD